MVVVAREGGSEGFGRGWLLQGGWVSCLCGNKPSFVKLQLEIISLMPVNLKCGLLNPQTGQVLQVTSPHVHVRTKHVQMSSSLESVIRN